MSAVIGGLIATVFVLAMVPLLEDGVGDVTINRSTTPEASRSKPVGDGSGLAVEDVYNRFGPGVVSVDVASDRGPGGGSGFVLDKNGHIVTNQHVVEGANAVSVRFSSGDRFDAEVAGEDPSTDTAVLKIDAPKELLEPLTLGDSDAVSVGEPVIAIGNPLNVGTSVTTGIVSGTGRPIKAPNNYTINGAVQTDAAINPGSSGGPLLDSSGNVIGVNSQIKSDTGSFQGVGFAVPANVVEGVVRQLITTGEVAHGYIGVRMEPVSVEELSVYSGVPPEKLAEEYGLPENGAIVGEVVEGGPAAEAGIRGAEGRPEIEGLEGLPIAIGDVITKVEGDRVSSSNDVIKIVNALKPGEKIELTVVTPGEKARQVEVRLDARPERT